MPKGRIGLSLDEDVLAILNEYGRCSFEPDESGVTCRLCERSAIHGMHSIATPTRTEITQTAIREWAARKEAAHG